MTSVAELSQAERREQLTIRAGLYRDITALFGLVDPHRLDAQFPGFAEAVAREVMTARGASEALAREVLAEILTARSLPALTVGAAPIDAEAMYGGMRLALPIGVKRNTVRGLDLRTAMGRALVNLLGVGGFFALQGGRQAQLNSYRAHPQITRYGRVLGPKPCGYCEDIASRGPWRLSDADVSASGLTEPFHNHCACSLAPMF